MRDTTTADSDKLDVAVIGAGPAGLTAAYEVSRLAPDMEVGVFEASDALGGISRTEVYDGYRIDIGGHRFFTKLPEVQEIWTEILGDEFLHRTRMSRIFYRGKFYDYPLKLQNALTNIGAYESFRIVASFFKWQIRPKRQEDSFEDWVINRFGGRLYMHFFKSYTQKVWGVDPKLIRSDWAAQRIKSMTLMSVLKKTLTGKSDATSLIDSFDYPRFGPGQMWERCAEILAERGQHIHMNSPVRRLVRDGTRIVAAEVAGKDGVTRIEADHFVNSMALRDLVHAIDPPPPAEIVAAADLLAYRDFLIVALVLDEAEPFADNWIYIHSPDVQVGRIQNFRTWSPDMVPDANHTSIGMEYFCNEDDDLWKTPDDELIDAAANELELLGLAKSTSVLKGHVIRQKKAYPVYDAHYQTALKTISDWLNTLENLQTIGRNGLHRYNNQDHSMLTALLAVRNILGGDHDIWNVNVERSYHEEMQLDERTLEAQSA